MEYIDSVIINEIYKHCDYTSANNFKNINSYTKDSITKRNEYVKLYIKLGFPERYISFLLKHASTHGMNDLIINYSDNLKKFVSYLNYEPQTIYEIRLSRRMMDLNILYKNFCYFLIRTPTDFYDLPKWVTELSENKFSLEMYLVVKNTSSSQCTKIIMKNPLLKINYIYAMQCSIFMLRKTYLRVGPTKHYNDTKQDVLGYMDKFVKRFPNDNNLKIMKRVLDSM